MNFHRIQARDICKLSELNKHTYEVGDTNFSSSWRLSRIKRLRNAKPSFSSTSHISVFTTSDRTFRTFVDSLDHRASASCFHCSSSLLSITIVIWGSDRCCLYWTTQLYECQAIRFEDVALISESDHFQDTSNVQPIFRIPIPA